MKDRFGSRPKHATWIAWLVVALIMAYLLPCGAHAQDELDAIRDLMDRGKYRDAADKLLTYVEGDKHQTAEVHSRLAVCYVKIGRPDLALRYIQWILAYGQISDGYRQTLEDAEHNPDTITVVLVPSSVRGDTGSFIYGGGKAFYPVESQPMASAPIQVVEAIPPADLRERLFEPSEREAAVASVESRTARELMVESVGHFVLATFGQHSRDDLRAIGSNLELALHLFCDKYRAAVPRHLITVYMAPGPYELHELARELHGIALSDVTIGYRFQEDLSIAGVIPGRAYGTLLHELLHIVMHNSFADIPPWMDEGAAALYEVSRTTGIDAAQRQLEGLGYRAGGVNGVLGPRTMSALKSYQQDHALPNTGLLDTATQVSLGVRCDIAGLPNWRGPKLAELRALRPSIEELVRMKWHGFDNPEGDERTRTDQRTANHATARYFVLYLQEQGKLEGVYSAFRARSPEDVEVDPATDAVRLLESLLGKPLAVVDDEFAEWFDRFGYPAPGSGLTGECEPRDSEHPPMGVMR